MAISNTKLVRMFNAGALEVGFAEVHPQDGFHAGLIGCELDTRDGSGLPRLHLQYLRHHFMYLTNAAEVEKCGISKELLALLRKDENGVISGHLFEKEVSHLWLCNFRRYGWSWTPDVKGESGYCVGRIWPNGECLIGNETAQDVIRSSFAETWSDGMRHYDQKFGYGSYCPLIALPAMRLLNEALGNKDSLEMAARCLEGAKKNLEKVAKEKGLI